MSDPGERRIERPSLSGPLTGDPERGVAFHRRLLELDGTLIENVERIIEEGNLVRPEEAVDLREWARAWMIAASQEARGDVSPQLAEFEKNIRDEFNRLMRENPHFAELADQVQRSLERLKAKL